MKIVYCTDSLCYPGGIQMVTIAKANALAAVPGNFVWIAVTDNKKEIIAPLDSRVRLIDLDVNYYEDDWKGTFYRIKGYFVKRKLHRERVRQQLDDIQPDIVISTGTSEKHFLPTLSISSKPTFIREFHFDKKYRIRSSLTLKGKLFSYLVNLYDYGWKIRKYSKIVVLTEEDKNDNWKKNKKVAVIPNPVTKIHDLKSSCCNKIVVASGRLGEQKNFESLLRVWSKVVRLHSDWHLHIWGDGTHRDKLQEMIIQLGLENSAFLKGYTHNMLEEMSKSSIFALSSTFEGFGLVIVEAMSVGIPVVSYSCPCGPKDIISHGVDGFLVDDFDECQFAECLSSLIEDDDKRKMMGANAAIKSQRYSIDRIVDQWMCLFNELRHN